MELADSVYSFTPLASFGRPSKAVDLTQQHTVFALSVDAHSLCSFDAHSLRSFAEQPKCDEYVYLATSAYMCARMQYIIGCSKNIVSKLVQLNTNRNGDQTGDHVLNMVYFKPSYDPKLICSLVLTIFNTYRNSDVITYPFNKIKDVIDTHIDIHTHNMNLIFKNLKDVSKVFIDELDKLHPKNPPTIDDIFKQILLDLDKEPTDRYVIHDPYCLERSNTIHWKNVKKIATSIRYNSNKEMHGNWLYNHDFYNIVKSKFITEAARYGFTFKYSS